MKPQLTVLVICVSAVWAFVCPRNYCDTMNCTEVTKLPCAENQKLEPNRSFCGCCPLCITQLGEGESCGLLQIRGIPPTVECTQPLQCINNTCQLP